MDGLLGHFRMHFIDCYFGIFITFAARRLLILFLLSIVLNGKMQGNLIRKHSHLLGVWYQGDETCFMPNRFHRFFLFEYKGSLVDKLQTEISKPKLLSLLLLLLTLPSL